MTRHGSVLPIPDDPRIAEWVANWPQIEATCGDPFPRSFWLGVLERILAEDMPASNSRDRNLTARFLAPFPLAERDWL